MRQLPRHTLVFTFTKQRYLRYTSDLRSQISAYLLEMNIHSMCTKQCHCFCTQQNVDSHTPSHIHYNYQLQICLLDGISYMYVNPPMPDNVDDILSKMWMRDDTQKPIFCKLMLYSLIISKKYHINFQKYVYVCMYVCLYVVLFYMSQPVCESFQWLGELGWALNMARAVESDNNINSQN